METLPKDDESGEHSGSEEYAKENVPPLTKGKGRW